MKIPGTKLTNRTAYHLTIELGLTVSCCTAEGWEVGRLRGNSTPESSRPDLRIWPDTEGRSLEGWCHVRALTPDGQAFLDLIQERGFQFISEGARA